jgi:hypothetical protein
MITERNKNKNRNVCAPGMNFDENSCFTVRALRIIAKHYNMNYPDKIPIGSTKKELLRHLREKLPTCEGDFCWLKVNFIKNINDQEIQTATFKPEKPKGQFSWLSSIDINEVLKQYEKIFPKYKFLGAVPIDFEKNQNITINKLIDFFNKGYRQFGIVINTDPHTRSGQHWMAVFINLNDNGIGTFEFFDSYGIDRSTGGSKKRNDNKIPKEINIFFIRLNNNNNIFKLDKKVNKFRHQYKDSECGMYSLNFIVERLYGKSFENISKNVIKDDEMNKRRNIYFRPN